MEKTEARGILKKHGLRTTGPRLAVLSLLSKTPEPLSYSEVIGRLGDTDWDPATIFRTLVKLSEVGLAPVVSRAGGVDRYAVISSENKDHRHAHFICEDCGRVTCLSDSLALTVSEKDRWFSSIRRAMVQLNGECPECLEAKGTA